MALSLEVAVATMRRIAGSLEDVQMVVSECGGVGLSTLVSEQQGANVSIVFNLAWWSCTFIVI